MTSVKESNSWFEERVKRKIGDSKNISFWSNMWLGDMRLKQRFARVFVNSENKEGKVFEVGEWCDGIWSWTFN